MIIKDFSQFNPRIKRKSTDRPYKLLVRYEHGDADLTTHEQYSFLDKEKFDNVVHFFYDCMNFVPKSAYGNLGHFDPWPDKVNAGWKEKEIVPKLEGFAEKWNVKDYQMYILGDQHYDQGFAALDGIKCEVNGIPMVFVFKEALETNKISLPNIGDIIDVNCNHIPGLGEIMFGGHWTDYLPNSGAKDYKKNTFKAKVLDCGIHFYHDEENKHYTEYTHFDYVLLLEALEDVLKDGHKQSGVRKLAFSMKGWDPDFETKFNKEKYDGLNYYEI